jgi:membrane protein DedA with SNARE-associated domain
MNSRPPSRTTRGFDACSSWLLNIVGSCRAPRSDKAFDRLSHHGIIAVFQARFLPVIK